MTGWAFGLQIETTCLGTDVEIKPIWKKTTSQRFPGKWLLNVRWIGVHILWLLDTNNTLLILCGMQNAEHTSEFIPVPVIGIGLPGHLIKKTGQNFCAQIMQENTYHKSITQKISLAQCHSTTCLPSKPTEKVQQHSLHFACVAFPTTFCSQSNSLSHCTLYRHKRLFFFSGLSSLSINPTAVNYST